RPVPATPLELDREAEPLLGGAGDLAIQAEGDAQGTSRPALELEAGVLAVLTEGAYLPHPPRGHQQPRPRVAHAEGRECLELAREVHADPAAPDADQRVEPLGLDEIGGVQYLPGMFEEGLPEGLEPIGPDLQAPSHPVATQAPQVLRARPPRPHPARTAK